jgi:hypothetical protein
MSKYVTSVLLVLSAFGGVSQLAAAQGVVAPETGGGWRQGKPANVTVIGIFVLKQ